MTDDNNTSNELINDFTIIEPASENDLSSLADLNLDLNSLDIESNNLENNNLESNNIIDNVNNLALDLSDEQIQQFYNYLTGKIPRPDFADKFFADADSRIRESNQLTAMMGLSFVPKLLAVEKSLIDDLCSQESLRFISNDEKLNRLQTLAAISTKFNEIAMKYTKISKDFTSVPSIYRQLLDKLMAVPGDKVHRLKAIPDLLDLPDDVWNRIMEILNQ